MIKSQDCDIGDVEHNLERQLAYDADCTVIAILPIAYKHNYLNIDFSDVKIMKDSTVTRVKIIWNSR